MAISILTERKKSAETLSAAWRSNKSPPGGIIHQTSTGKLAIANHFHHLNARSDKNNKANENSRTDFRKYPESKTKKTSVKFSQSTSKMAGQVVLRRIISTRNSTKKITIITPNNHFRYDARGNMFIRMILFILFYHKFHHLPDRKQHRVVLFLRLVPCLFEEILFRFSKGEPFPDNEDEGDEEKYTCNNQCECRLIRD